MTKKKIASWRERRWKQFLKVYKTNPDFGEKIRAIIRNDYNIHLELQLRQLFGDYGVPWECEWAAIRYARGEDLTEEQIEGLIKAPFLFWNNATSTMGPNKEHTPFVRFKGALISVGLKNLVTDEQLHKLLEVMFYNHTVLEFNGLLKKSEMHELIDEYFDEMAPMFNDNSLRADWLYSPALRGNVSLKSDKALDIDRLVVELKEKGMNDKQIATYLVEHDYGIPDERQVRVIRNRAKKQRHDT